MRSWAIGFCTFFFFGFTGCSYDNHLIEEDIKGVWIEEVYLEDHDRISRLEYNFKGDNALEALRIEVDKDSRKVLGYRSKTVGNYTIAGNKLSFYNLVTYNNDDRQGSYTEMENLIKEFEGGTYDITYKIEERGKKLVFIYPPCGELANCIGTKTLIKGESINL